MKGKIILALLLFSILTVCCDDKENQGNEESFEPHPTWTADSTNNFWE